MIRFWNVLEIEGVSGAGGYAPVFLPKGTKIVGRQPLPAGPVEPARFFSENTDASKDCFAHGLRETEPGRLGEREPEHEAIEGDRIRPSGVHCADESAQRVN
jgi:hypothetical protein